jgi:transposase
LIDDVRASKYIQQTGVVMHDINTFLPFWEGFSVVTIKPDGDAWLE